MKLFAKAGEKITCENGHEICAVACDILVADMFVPTHLKNWTQPEPEVGLKPSKVLCHQCGALFWHAEKGQHFHFKRRWFRRGGWRAKAPSKAYKQRLMMERLDG